MKPCITLLFLLLLAGYTFGQQDNSSLDTLLTAAQQAQAANNYAAAAASYEQAVKLRPEVPELWANLGLMQHETGDYAKAVQSFEHALRLKPSLYVPNLFLGIDDVNTGKAKEAIPLLEKAQKMNANDPLPSLTLGRAFSSVGEYSSAIRELRRALRIDPKQSSAWFDLGIAQLHQVETDARTMTEAHADTPWAKALFAESLVKQSRYKEADALYKNILAAQDQPPCIPAEAGWLALKQGNTEPAEAQFKSELSEHAECGMALLGLARLRVNAGENAAAMQLLAQLWSRDHGFFLTNAPQLLDGLSQEQMQSFLNEAAQQQASGKIDAAFFNALTQPAQNPEYMSDDTVKPALSAARNEAAQAYKAGQDSRCAAFLKAGVEHESADTLKLLAACSFFAGDYGVAYDAGRALAAQPSQEQAEALYWSIKANERLAYESLDRFQQLEPNSARTHILLGDIYRQRERYDDAQKEYEKALALSPNDTAALLGLASAYYDDANIDKTIEVTQQALIQSPDDPEINLLMGEALISQHKFPESKPYLLKGLKAKPQMLPHVHALLGEAYASDGKTQDAIRELKLGANSDQDGSVHYYLAREYSKLGDKADADAALAQMKTIQQKRREGAVIAVDDSHSTSLDDAP